MASPNNFIDQSRRSRPSDDSSSISSMSSFSRRALCHVCKEPESLVKPLVRCKSCRGSWHPGCHKPTIDDPKKDGFQCAKCIRKANAKSEPSHTSNGQRNGVPGLSQEQHVPQAPNHCQIQGCSAPVYMSVSNAVRLCKRHEIQEKHRHANAQKETAGFKVPSASRPFKKKKLYPVQPDDDTKILKRKRAPSTNKGAAYNDSELPVVDDPIFIPHLQESRTEGPRGKSAESTSRPAPQGSSSSNGTRQKISLEEILSSTVEPPKETRPSNLNIGNPMSGETRKRYQATVESEDEDEGLQSGKHPKANTHEPLNAGTPSEPSLNDPSAQNEAGESSGQSTLSHEGEIEMPNQDDVEMSDYPSNSHILGTRATPSERIVIVPSSSSNTAMLQEEATENEEGTVAVTEQSTSQTINAIWISRSSPSLIASSTKHNEDIIWENPETDFPMLAGVSHSLEVQRQQRAETFDNSALDSWLAKQALPIDDTQPTAKELAESQIWGHIDPRTAWTKEPSVEWLSEKRQEIEARGGRKANFGKLLTAQVVKERREKGWGIHQNKDVVDNETSEESARALEELFGIANIDGLEPGVRDGQLVMVEKAAQGRKEPAVYIVG